MDAAVRGLELGVPQDSWQEMSLKVRKLLEDLIPEAGAQVVFRDIGGHEHTAPVALAARRQFLLLRRLDALGPRALGRLQQLAKLRQGPGSSAAGFVVVIAQMITDPELEKTVRDLFTLLHPGAVDRAIRLGTVPDVAIGEDGQPLPVGPFEVFSIEEVVKAIVPFLLQPIRSLLDSVLPVLQRVLQESPSPTTS